MFHDTDRKKRILVYGDSNTFGLNPRCSGKAEVNESRRFSREVRWPGALEGILGESWTVIEDALSGRTLCYEDPAYKYRNGKKTLASACQSHYPVDLLILFLGGNDIKFTNSVGQIAIGLQSVVESLKNKYFWEMQEVPQIMIIAPAPFNPFVLQHPNLKREFTMEHIEMLQKFPEAYQRVADVMDCLFLNAAEYAAAPPIDGVHYDETQHRKLAEAVAEKILASDIPYVGQY